MNRDSRTLSRLVSGLVMACTGTFAGAAPVGTQFRYQGQLNFNGVPLNGTADIGFSLWDDATGGSPVGGFISLIGVPVVNGLFSVDVDFGSGAFNGDERWLEVEVRSPSDPNLPFTTLSPRTPIGAVPYAQAIPGLRVQPHADSPSLIGGSSANSVPADVPGATIGGGGTTPDKENRISARYGTIGGGFGNSVGADAIGATIGGGVDHTASGDKSTIAGGEQNTTMQPYSTIGGGLLNRAEGDRSTIAGGSDNAALASGTTVGGGAGNQVAAMFGTISGGGPLIDPSTQEIKSTGNRVFDEFGTIGGGTGNRAGADDGSMTNDRYATVGGGQNNLALWAASTVSGGAENEAQGIGAAVGGGFANIAKGYYATIAGGGPSNVTDTNTGNRTYDNFCTIGGGGNNKAGSDDDDFVTAKYVTVGGGEQNEAAAAYATISGGGPSDFMNSQGESVVAPGNIVFDEYGTVSGGSGNQAGADDGSTNDHYATVGGGFKNAALFAASTVSGGSDNEAGKLWATVGGGADNIVRGVLGAIAGGGKVLDANGVQVAAGNRVWDDYGFVGGGGNNQAGSEDGISDTAKFATVAGGAKNAATAEGAAVLGGFDNSAAGLFATVSGGQANTAGAEAATVSGGSRNDCSGTSCSIGGGGENTASGVVATIAGGSFNTCVEEFCSIGGGSQNSCSGKSCTVGGGLSNVATADTSTVAGGWENDASGINSTVGGGRSNFANGETATVSGGWNNSALGLGATVAGGQGNVADGSGSTISGGVVNLASGNNSTVGGGDSHMATGDRSTIGGGVLNDATGMWSTVTGGADNEATGIGATVPGGYLNRATGNMSLAGGLRAKALHGGAFVWGDETQADVASTGPNQFIVRASGGTRIYSDAGLSSGVTLSPGGGSWSSVSDRNRKENIVPVDTCDVLDKVAGLPISTWNYTTQDASIRHMGPMGQDFHAAFAIGEEPAHISTIDADGVALAAIQGLYELVQNQAVELESLRAERLKADHDIEAMRRDLAEVQADMERLKQDTRIPTAARSAAMDRSDRNESAFQAGRN